MSSHHFPLLLKRQLERKITTSNFGFIPHGSENEYSAGVQIERM